MAVAELGPCRVYFEDTGSDKPAILFSHGLLMDHTMFAHQIEALRSEWRCITWDARGHGAAAPSAGPHVHAGAILTGLLDYLGVERAVLAGTAQGGFASLQCALEHPERVRALVLIDSQPGPDAPAQAIGSRALADFWLAGGPSEHLIANTERLLLGEGFVDAAAWRDKWWHCSAANFLACLNALGEREDLTERLPELHLPALVIHGRQDIAVPLLRARDMASRLGARLAVIEGAGHAANMTHPVPVNEVLTDFLAALAA
jgi:pimeloyl-ACP methyl ester carboxylesterase